MHLFPQQAIPFAAVQPIPQTASKAFPTETGSHATSLRSGEPHDSGHRPGDLAVTSGLLRQVFATVGSELIETSAAIVGRQAPFALDPAPQLETLESRI